MVKNPIGRGPFMLSARQSTATHTAVIDAKGEVVATITKLLIKALNNACEPPLKSPTFYWHRRRDRERREEHQST